MSMTLQVNGLIYDNFLSGQVETRLDALSNTFTFTMARTGTDPLPFAVGSDCVVRVDDNVVVTGTIELMTVDYDDISHSITLAGRDKTSAITDSTLERFSDLSGNGLTLQSVIEKVINQIGADLTVINNVPGLETFNGTEDIISFEDGENAFGYIEKLAQRLQVLLTSNGEGNVVISRSATTSSGLKLQNVLDAVDNNIKNGSVSYDNTGRFNFYQSTSQKNPVALQLAGFTDPSIIVDQKGNSTDPEIPAGRQLVLTPDTSNSDTTNTNRALWEANVRKARGRLYTVTVAGFSLEGILWTANQRVEVQDVFAGISGEMLCNTVINKLDEESGETTEITLVDINSYQLTLADPEYQEIGEGFV